MKIRKLITNNPIARDRFFGKFDIEYHNVSYLEILILVRDYIHKGHKLLTHPLSGSIKPKETPYKSVVISANAQGLDFESLDIIEESITCCKKFADMEIPAALADFMEIDCSLIDIDYANAQSFSHSGLDPESIQSLL